jgi:ankyrin repeat protein
MRRMDTPDALLNTCDWVFQSSKYQAWIDRKDVDVHHGLLCIKGGPGSGKSVLMKEAFKRASQDMAGKRTVADHFFNGRGDGFDTSPLGLYRALIYEMIMQDEIFSSLMMAEYEKKYERQHDEAGHPYSNIRWDERELKDILEVAAATGSLQPTRFFIDALDECDAMRLRDVVGFFRTLVNTAFSSGWSLNICLSCRHFPAVGLDSYPEIVMEHGNEPDIARYVQMKLKQATGRKDIQRVEIETLKRARGNFFWVSLVSDLLLQDLDNGKTLRDIFTTLEAVPKDLESLFADLFQRLKPHERSQSVALFQLVFMARWPLTPLEVCLMLGFTRQHRSLLEWEDSIDAIDDHDQAMKLIRSLSCGLIGFRHTHQSPRGTVEFVHESVRQYLCNGAFGHLARGMTNEQIALGHGAMTKICINLLLIQELNPTSRNLAMIDKHYGSLYFAAANLLRLLKILEDAGTGFDIILRTISSRRANLWNRLRWLLDLKRLGRPSHHSLIWHETIDGELLRCETLLQAVCYLQLPTLAEWLVQNGVNANEAPGFSARPLILAIQRGRNSTRVIQTLLRYGASTNAHDRRGRSALHLAARLGLLPVVKMLLTSGAELESRDQERSTPLHLAVNRGHHEIAKCLLRRGADPDVWWERMTPDGRYTEWTPLHIAVLQNDMKMVRILVQEMACLEIFDNGNRLPYDLAVSLGYRNIKTFILQAMTREGISEETQLHLQGRKLRKEVTYMADPLSEIRGVVPETASEA